MEYNHNLDSLLNFSNLASGPFCIGEDNLCDVSSNLLSCDLYFNGLNSFGLGDDFNSEKKLSKIPGDHNIDLVSDFLKNESFTSDYFSKDGLITSLQQSDDDIFDDVDIATQILDRSDEVFSSSDSVSSPHSSTSSDNDIPFTLLATVDTDETVRKSESCADLLFEFVAAPLGSPSCSSLGSPDEDISSDDMSGEETNATFLEFTDEKSPDMGFEHQITPIDIMPATEINLLSPKSVDSGVSMASSCENSIFDEVSFDLVDLLSMSNSSPMENWKQYANNQAGPDLISGSKQIIDFVCPNSVDSCISVSSDETSYDSDDISLNQSILTTPLKLTAILHPVTGLEDHALANESGSSEENCRYMPYKGKRKTPEQKIRKKKQNRSAASRYRSKKKDEFNNIFAEASKLDEQNKELKDKVDGLRNEIDYLKSLMLDVINARLSKKQNVLVSMDGLLQSVH